MPSCTRNETGRYSFSTLSSYQGLREAAVALLQLEAGVFAQVEIEPDAPAVRVGIDAALELTADQTLQVGEELHGEDEGGPSLEFGFGCREHIVRPAIALGDCYHVIVLTELAGIGAANFVEAPSAQFDGVVIGGRVVPCRHDDLRQV